MQTREDGVVSEHVGKDIPNRGGNIAANIGDWFSVAFFIPLARFAERIIHSHDLFKAKNKKESRLDPLRAARPQSPDFGD